mmetsp:Transcript_96280/g.241343  ORF Transcript_96280/g.241343 Transcript_96280/m.241343 type:complete len:240 (-) Transcript_96280:737-1456(-)
MPSLASSELPGALGLGDLRDLSKVQADARGNEGPCRLPGHGPYRRFLKIVRRGRGRFEARALLCVHPNCDAENNSRELQDRIRHPRQSLADVLIHGAIHERTERPCDVLEERHHPNGLTKLARVHHASYDRLDACPHDVLAKDDYLNPCEEPPPRQGNTNGEETSCRTQATYQDATLQAYALLDPAVQEQVDDQADDTHAGNRLAPEHGGWPSLVIEELILHVHHTESLESREADRIQQ